MQGGGVWQAQEAAAIAAAAHDLLSQHGLAPTPSNYELAFLHVAGRHRALSADIEHCLKSPGAFNEETCALLHERHLTHDHGRLAQTREAISQEVEVLLSALRGAGDDAQGYAQTLTQASHALDANLDPDTLSALVKGLAGSALSVAARNHELSEGLKASTQKMEALQTALEHVTTEAVTDALTGLANRRAFDRALEQLLSERASEVCLLMCDIDHFKRVNDTCGHLVGDQVIRFIAGVLKTHASGEFLAARYGGEEFAIIMPRTNMHRAQGIAATIKAAVSAKKLTRKSTGESIGAITASFGLARRRLNDTPESLIKRADACLYVSKQNGRDRITIDSDLTSTCAA